MPQDEVIQQSDFEAIESAMVKERCCKVCALPEYFAQFKRCSADNNESTVDRISKCGWCKEKHKGKICKEDKNPELKYGHIIIETRRLVPKAIYSGPLEFKTNPLKRCIGYEIEVSKYIDGRKCTALARKWGAGMVHDCAFEMNTPPANGDKLVDMVKQISEGIRKYGAKCEGTGAGLHTHVDVRDAGWSDMRKIIMLYGILEPALYSVIDPRRASNNMCKPLGGTGLVKLMSDYYYFKNNIQRLVYAETAYGKGGGGNRGRSKDPAGGDRYTGLNLHSWWMRGTIEFRMHHGTTKWDKMLYWGMLAGSLCETAINRGDREIDSWPSGLNGLLQLAPTADAKKWVQERWDYFAAKRPNPKVPIIDESVFNPEITD